jgi:hypothetical protein
MSGMSGYFNLRDDAKLIVVQSAGLVKEQLHAANDVTVMI